MTDSMQDYQLLNQRQLHLRVESIAFSVATTISTELLGCTVAIKTSHIVKTSNIDSIKDANYVRSMTQLCNFHLQRKNESIFSHSANKRLTQSSNCTVCFDILAVHILKHTCH